MYGVLNICSVIVCVELYGKITNKIVNSETFVLMWATL